MLIDGDGNLFGTRVVKDDSWKHPDPALPMTLPASVTAASDPLDVEISVVDHDARKLTSACLRGLPGACGNLRWHATLVDNLPAATGMDAVRGEFPWADVLSNSAPLGFGANHNMVIGTVLACSAARYVLVLNNDTVLPPRSIERLVGYADTHVELGAVGPLLVDDDGSPQPSSHPFPEVAASIRRALRPATPTPTAAGTAPGWVSGACLLLRTDALRQVGLFDTRFFLFFEDVDLAGRLAAAGWASGLCPELTVVHHNHGTVGRPELALAMERQMLRSAYLYFDKHHGRVAAQMVALTSRFALALRATKALGEGLLVRPDPGRTRPLPSFLLRLASYNPRRSLPHEEPHAGPEKLLQPAAPALGAPQEPAAIARS